MAYEQTDKELGAEIAAARVAAGLSKEAAAKRAGVTTTTWRRAEAGERVQGHKLAAILTAVGIPAFPVEDSKGNPLPGADTPFMLPARIERGYTATVDFSKAVAEEVPELAQRATRLMLDAASLFADAGNLVFARTEGGDGNAEALAGGPASTSQDDYDLVAHDEEHTIESEQEHDEFP